MKDKGVLFEHVGLNMKEREWRNLELMNYRTKTKYIHMIEWMEVRHLLGECHGKKCDCM